MFSSEVSMRVCSVKLSMVWIFTICLVSIGHGRCQRRPGMVVATCLPKRRMMPRSAASTVYRPLKAQMAASTTHDRADAEASARARSAYSAIAAAAAAEQAGQAPLQIPQDFVQVGRSLFGLVAAPRRLRLPPELPPGSFHAMVLDDFVLRAKGFRGVLDIAPAICAGRTRNGRF